MFVYIVTILSKLPNPFFNITNMELTDKVTHLFQYALIEKLLQLFITVVDAELLKAVVLKIL